MSDAFGGSSVKLLEWVKTYRRLSSKSIDQLTEEEKNLLKELEQKLMRHLDPQTEPGAQQRQSLRVRASFAVEVQSAGHFKKLYMKNISGGGVYVETPKPYPVGSEVDLQMILPRERNPITVKTTVAWVNPKKLKDLNPGMGLKFVQLTDVQWKKIQSLISDSLEREINDQKDPAKKK